MRTNTLIKIVFFWVSSGAIFGQTARPYWYTLEQGKAFFRNGEYGQALIAFEDARRSRTAMYDKMEDDLIVVLSTREVRQMRDSLDRVERYIEENHLEMADYALKELYHKIPRDSFGGSARTALNAISSLKNYPEAEFWLGEVYRVEGELVLALKQYQKAHDQRSNLENPDFDLDILYKMVYVLQLQRNYGEMEIIAGKILEQDTLWQGDKGFFARSAMQRVLETEGISRFLTIYRYNGGSTEAMHRTLGFFYYTSGRHANALDHLIFSFMIQNTVIINEALRNNYGFNFTSQQALLDEVKKNAEVQDYLEKVEYYKTIYYLGSAFYATGKAKVAREFWLLLKDKPEAGEWTVRAGSQLKSPFIEKPTPY